MEKTYFFYKEVSIGIKWEENLTPISEYFEKLSKGFNNWRHSSFFPNVPSSLEIVKNYLLIKEKIQALEKEKHKKKKKPMELERELKHEPYVFHVPGGTGIEHGFIIKWMMMEDKMWIISPIELDLECEGEQFSCKVNTSLAGE